VSNRPTHRIRYTDKATKKKYDAGVIWPPRNAMDGLLGSLSPQKTDEDGQYPKMALAEAARRCAAGEGFLDVWSTEKAAPKPQRPVDAGDFGDGSDGPPF
jgi:hypothetical protein